MHHCAIEDPSNVVILNVNGLDLQEIKEEDFLLFDNVLRIDANENQLPFRILKRLHIQHNQIRTIPFLKVLQGRQVVQEYSKTAMKRKQITNPPMNYFQHGLNSAGDELIKSTIFEEDEENPTNNQTKNIVTEDEDIALPAFPELQYLDISSNLIEEEDDVMAVASWPSLTEIILADNPLVQRHVGFPPLIESFLMDRLGMKVHRVNPSLKSEKQFYAKPIKKHRQVTSRIAKVPKVPIDQLISGAVKQYIDYVKNDTDVQSDQQLLPLLTGTSEQNSSSDEDKYKTIDTTLNEEENKFNSNSTTVGQSPNQQTENIFMTEFEHDDIYQNVIQIERPHPPEPSGPLQPSMLPDEKFKGFEVFLDIENEEDITVPKNVIHCVRDLKQILRNPLVIRHDNVQVTRRQRTFIPKRMERTLPPVKLPNRPKVEEINKLLDIIRDRETIIDQPLDKVLNNKKDKINQRRAKSLVTQIQHHYEQVRGISLRNVRTPGTILDTAIERLQKFDTNISINKESLPSRLPTA
ncbi:unnamed protein product [Rotaria sp. Silwood1]|nr:unnamed protein product [Rotaria sp. Silwood1]